MGITKAKIPISSIPLGIKIIANIIPYTRKSEIKIIATFLPSRLLLTKNHNPSARRKGEIKNSTTFTTTKTGYYLIMIIKEIY